jgi:flagellar biosynthesis/type III secretory pathway protein FliH
MTALLTIQVPSPIEGVAVVGSTPGAAPLPSASGGDAHGPILPGREDPAARMEAERQGLAQARQALEAAAAELARSKEELLKEAEAQVVGLAFHIARKVLMQEIDAGRYRIEPVVQEVLRHIPTRHNIVVHLNPEDLARWQESLQAEAGASGAAPDGLKSTGEGVLLLAGARVVPDSRIGRGECLVDTGEGTVRSVIEEHLEQLAEALKSSE